MIQRINYFYILVFLYFLTLSAEKLNVTVGIFKPRLNHLIALVLLGSVFFVRKKLIFDKKILFPFLWILGSMVISALISISPLRSFGYVNVYLFSFVCYFIIPFNLVVQEDSQKILKIYWTSFVCIGLYAALQVAISFFGIYDPFATQTAGTISRAQGWSYEPSYYALYMTAFVMFYNGWVIFHPHGSYLRKKWALLLGINLLLIISTSTGVIFSYPCFLLLALFFKTFSFTTCVKRRVLSLASMLLGVFCLIAVALNDLFLNTFYKFFYKGFAEHWSFNIRWASFVQCWDLFLEHPIFGLGVGGVGPYIYQKSYGALPEMLQEYEFYEPSLVSTEVLASLGIVGLVGFIFLGRYFYQAFQEALMRSSLDLEERARAIALFISVIVLMIALQYNQSLFRPYIWAHAGITFGYLYKLKTSSLASTILINKPTALK